MEHPEVAFGTGVGRLGFDRSVRLELRGAQIGSDGSLLLMRELDDAVELSDLTSVALCDNRTGKNTTHRLDGQFRQSVYGRRAGSEDVNDTDRLPGTSLIMSSPATATATLGYFFQADAAYTIAAIHERLENAGYSYAIRLPTSTVLKEKIVQRLTRPMGRSSQTKVNRLNEDFLYQAASWDKPRRVIVEIEWHPGEMFPNIGCIVTNLPIEPDWVVRFYHPRGTAEQHIKEGQYAFHWTRLSYRKFCDNEGRLQLHALVYNLATFLRCIELPKEMA